MSQSNPGAVDISVAHDARPAELFVGRREELRRLGRRFDDALRGAGSVVLVTGETGMGKTSLLRAFVADSLEKDRSWTYCRARCATHFGSGEAYLPFLQALGNLLLGPAREVAAGLLRQFAPTWCQQLPASGVPAEELRERTIGATKDRMLREFGDLFEAASVTAPLVGVIEDVQWADPSSMDLLRHLAHRVRRLRMLIIVTFRASEMDAGPEQLRATIADLRLEPSCEELRLGPLGSDEVKAYFEARFPVRELPGELIADVEARTEGHPLFLTSLIQYLVDQHHLELRGERWELFRPVSSHDLGAPENVRALIRRRLEGLAPEDQELLTAASVMSREFLSSVVARMLDAEELAVEERLRRLERSQRLLYSLGEEELPDGSLAVRFRFANALYGEVLYEELLGNRRAMLHRRAGEELRKAYGALGSRVAAQLAVHFERGRDFPAASDAQLQAGDNAAALYDNVAADERYAEALRLLERSPDAERGARALRLLERRGIVNIAMSRFPDAEAHFTQILERARSAGDAEHECAALSGLCNALFFTHRVEEMALRVDEAWRAAEHSGSASRQIEALLLLAQLAQVEGQLDECEVFLEEALAGVGRLDSPPLLLTGTLLQGALRYWRSEFILAEASLREARGLASERRDGFKLLFATRFLGLSLCNLGRMSEALACFRSGIEIARRNGDHFWLPTLSNHIGLVHRELLAIPEALEHDREGLRLAEARRVGEAECGALLNLGVDLTLAGDLDSAFEHLEAARSAAPSNWFSWFFELRLQSALAGYWLARGEHARASDHAVRLLQGARRHGARVYVVAAQRLAAEAALAGGQVEAAGAALAEAYAALAEAGEAPLEAWRLHALTGRVREAQGDPGGAQYAWRAAAKLVERIAAATEEAPLRATFLGSEAARRVLQKAEEA